MMEGQPVVERQEPSLVETREIIFGSLIMNRLVEHFEDSLDEVGFAPEFIEEAKKELSQYSENDVKAAIAIPQENSEKYLGRFKDKNPQELVRTLVENGKKYGFTVGYHVSPQEIKGGHIEGKEKDHRDNDMPMAYYSLHYKDLYEKKIANFLYLIRAEVGESSTHRRDNDGSWGRATSLAIIDKFNLPELRIEVEEKAKEYLEKGTIEEKKKAA